MGRMRRRMCDLPPKLVGEKILSKVPITSLRQVRSTCKLWEGLSKDWVLGKEAASRTQQFLGFMTMDSKVCSLRFNLRSKEEGEAEAEAEEEEEEEEEAVDVSIKQVDILNKVEISQVYQCEGLLLCVGKDNSRLVAWNPYLGQTRTIEPRKSFDVRDMYALGYDKKTRNHKILRYLDDHDGLEHHFAFEIYDFGSNSWRLVEVRPDWEVVASPHRAEVRPGEVVASRYRGVSLKGDTYFFAREKIGPDFFDPTLSSSRRSTSLSLCFGVQDCDDFLLCFDFTREKMGPRLPLPFHTLLPLGEVVSLSCVREEELAVLFQHGGEAEIFEELDVWVTTRIEPKDVSWTKFLTFDMRPLTRFGVGQLHDHASFFIDEQEKVAVVFDVVSFRDKENEPGYHSAFIIGQGGYFKSVLLGEAPNVHRPDRFLVTEYCPPLVCSSSYLPSLVQIKFNQPRKRKQRLGKREPVDEKPATKKAAPAKAASSSSDEESEDEKPAPNKAKAAKKDSSSSDESESESEDEEKTPKKKSTDVEMVDAEQKQPKTPATPSTGGCKTLFVGNLSFQVEQKDVEEFFKGAGEVVDVRFATSKEDGRFRGFGHVEFASAEAAAKAMELNGQALLGRDIRLDIANERGERPAYTPQSGFRSGGGGGGTSVFVKGFDSSLPESDFKSALSEHFASKGIAYLGFKDGADKAFALNGTDLGGWSLVVDEARPRDNRGGGFSSGRK